MFNKYDITNYSLYIIDIVDQQADIVYIHKITICHIKIIV